MGSFQQIESLSLVDIPVPVTKLRPSNHPFYFISHFFTCILPEFYFPNVKLRVSDIRSRMAGPTNIQSPVSSKIKDVLCHHNTLGCVIMSVAVCWKFFYFYPPWFSLIIIFSSSGGWFGVDGCSKESDFVSGKWNIWSSCLFFASDLRVGLIYQFFRHFFFK